MTNQNNTERFSNRVENYIKYRPGYPDELINFLKTGCGLKKESVIADIGSGTGISTEVFLKNGNTVYAIEPNKEMRNAAEELLKNYPCFISINGTAENTTLKDKSVDMIISGQAFHWFDFDKCKFEFKRILRNDGYIVLIWNSRISKPGFMNDYEELLKKYGTDYTDVNHENIDESVIKYFFTPGHYKLKKFPNYQKFDYEGFKGRLLSCSYIPLEDNPVYNDMIDASKKIFRKNCENEKVIMEYETFIYYGKI